MTVKIGINGFGRIGRLAFRRILELSEQASSIEVVAINDLTNPEMLAYLLKYDSVHGTLDADVSSDENGIFVNGKHYTVYSEKDASKLKWVENDDVDYVLEATGFYTSAEKAKAHLDAGAKKVLISAPAGNLPTIVYGVNQETLTANDKIVSAGSCTTQSLGLITDVLEKEFGVKTGLMVTVHAYTASQSLQDGPKSSKFEKRQANRDAASNSLPHSSGAAKSIGMVIPSLNGKLTGSAIRVPVQDGSITELTAVLKTQVSVDQVNNAMKKYESDSFGYNGDGLVSTDIIGDTHGTVFDPTQTEIITGDGQQLVKVAAWYDNEYGFTANMIRTLLYFSKL
ncbi:type I glyceraldehyde-3-phosphate dehydrogenase [Fructobacillus cardui]|uniref:Glyceraldehyde-3-phosphate dehydrogenase n=1 Tax=Fructobacillus cardui TaxID=2893170 RepID=A0ABM9N2F9_9LACO|nr:Glyceraldehyde-3-phosphate dehydrogenase/erythrose-4-phosphate dehydrogenase (GapA) [Fructobacillus cardui]